jgi:phosphomannomutase/phosphoglucomutase
MKLPFRAVKASKQSSGNAAPVMQTVRGSISLRNQILMLLLVGVLLIVLVPVASHLAAVLKLQVAADRYAQLMAHSIATSYRQWLEYQVAGADLVVADPAISGVLDSGNPAELLAQAKDLEHLFPGAIRVRLLKPGIEAVDLKASPPISYAALDMLRHAETRETPPPVEAHMSGTPRQHINLVRRILDSSGRRVIGMLMVSYSTQQLQKLLGGQDSGGYLELQQAVSGGDQLILGSRGDAVFKQGAGDAVVPIAGTRWQIAYWSGESFGVEDIRTLLPSLVAVAVAVLLFILLVWFVSRRLGLALRSDQAALLTIVKDMRDGRVRQSYPSVLVEMHDTVELMTRTAASGIREARAAADSGMPADVEASAVAEEVVDPLEGDLLFDDNALDIAKVEIEEQKVNPVIFRSYDIRGVVGETLNEETAYEIGRAVGSEAYFRGEQTVVVGRDGRLSSPELAEQLIRGLKATGRDVKDVGLVPTPILYFAAQYLGSSSGVMITGSHNPAVYNGFKIVLGGETLSGEAIQSLRQRIEKGDLLTGEGTVEAVAVLPDYIERIKSDIQLLRSLKLVIDCGNGAAGIAAPDLFRQLGCEVVELFCDVDGNFPNHHPDPGQPENLSALINAVQSEGAELGLAFDGDGDRLGVVNAQGAVIWPDRLLMLLAIDVLSRNPGAQIIYDVKCSRHLAEVISNHGGEPVMWATGHSLIKAKMKETGALLAGEMSGHIFYRERWFGFDDALYAAARLLEILANDERSSSEIFAALPDSFATPELSIPMAEGEAAVFMEKLLNGAHFEDARIATIDGLRAEFDRGWGLVRASNTTPSLVLRFEADDELALHSVQEEFRRVLLQTDPQLQLPF